jgi:hypothetical protein
MTTPASTTFLSDPLHPTMLLCECCGEPVCARPADREVMEHASGLTAQQAALAWPEQAAPIREHAVVCLWRRHPTQGDVGVYVHMTPWDGE